MFLHLTTLLSATEEPKVVVEISPDSCSIGDNIFYLIRLTHSESQLFNFPSDTDEVAFYPFEIRERKKLSEENQDGFVVSQYRYTLTIYETGTQIIPPLDLPYLVLSRQDTSERSVRLDSKSIFVLSVLDTSKKDISDIKPIQSLPLPTWIYLVSALTLLVIIAGGYWLFTYWQKRRLAEKPKKIEPTKPPYLLAKEKLSQLEAYPLLSQDDYKHFYSDLTEIIREFIEAHHHVPTLDQLTSEILYALQKKLSLSSLSRYQQLFERADLVKFAKFFPSKIEARESLKLAFEIVDEAAPNDNDHQTIGNQPLGEKASS